MLVAKSWPQQFIPFSRRRKDTDSCVITNALPKNGTYFINSIVERLGHWENIQAHIIPGEWYTTPLEGDFIFTECLERFSIKKLVNGQFIAAHLPWSRDAEQVIGKVTPTRRVKHVFLYRDPRDALVSYMKFITHSPTYYRTPRARARQDFMQEKLSNDDERLTFVIQERQEHYSVKYDYLAYEPWLSSRNCCAIKFEELFTEFTGIKENGFGNVLEKLFDYLEIDTSAIDPIRFHTSVHGKSITASGEKNKIGQYKHYLKAQHYNMLDNSGFRKILDTFGYEW